MLSYCTRNPCWCCHWVGSMNFENFWDKIELRHCKSHYRFVPIKMRACRRHSGNWIIPASLYNQPQQLSYQPVITADIGRAGWPALVQIRAINVPVGFYCSRNVRVVFYLTMSEIQLQCPLSNFLKGQCRLSQITPSTPLWLYTPRPQRCCQDYQHLAKYCQEAGYHHPRIARAYGTTVPLPWQKSLQSRVRVAVTWIRLSQSTVSVKCLTTIIYSWSASVFWNSQRTMGNTNPELTYNMQHYSLPEHVMDA